MQRLPKLYVLVVLYLPSLCLVPVGPTFTYILYMPPFWCCIPSYNPFLQDGSVNYGFDGLPLRHFGSVAVCSLRTCPSWVGTLPGVYPHPVMPRLYGY